MKTTLYCPMLYAIFLLLQLCNVSMGIGQHYFENPDVNVVPQPDIEKVHLIFMNHLDVGYSDYGQKRIGLSANVLNAYFQVYFPAAISLSQKMVKGGYVETFKYTTHPWLLYFFLHCPEHLKLANIEIKCPAANQTLAMMEAIKRGDILWHDGPMNMNFENLDQFGLEVALNISANLNTMFGINKPQRVLSIRDVPGVTRGIIRTLRAHNFVAITSGVNSGSAPPAVPPLSRWKAPHMSGDKSAVPEIIYMQDPFGYPDPPGPDPNHPGGLQTKYCHRAPGTNEVLCFMFRNDNMGPPQSIPEVLNAYEILRARYTNAHIFASNLESFFSLVWNKSLSKLPVIDQEMGDTWIQGTASDPKKFARFRAMQRLFQSYVKMGYPMTPRVFNAARFMIKPAEHTYGLNTVNDVKNWNNTDFAKVRNGKYFIQEELSWVEQRQYEQLALDVLGPDHILTKWILHEFKEMAIFDAVNFSDYKKVSGLKTQKSSDGPYNFTCTNSTHSLNVGFQDGAIVYLDTSDSITVSPSNPLGQLIYRTYNESDTEFFLKYYKTYWNTGYGKPNSTMYASPVSQFWPVSMRSIYRSVNDACAFVVVVSSQDSQATDYYGMPSSVLVKWIVDMTTNQIFTEVYWDDKHPTRLMEAMFIKFQPKLSTTTSSLKWYFSKVGELIDPMNVMFNGSQYQHTVDDGGVQVSQSTNPQLPLYKTIPWDTGITCPILPDYGPTVWPAPLFPLAKKYNKPTVDGIAFNLFNNVWNTNYIYWYPFHGDGTENDSKFKARFTTSIQMTPRLIKKTSNKGLDDTLYYKTV